VVGVKEHAARLLQVITKDAEMFQPSPEASLVVS
jgi:hypothetical protein